jgi:hypothetical protein
MELTLMAVKAARIKVFTVKKRPNIPCLIIAPPAIRRSLACPASQSNPPSAREIESQAGRDNSVPADNIYAPDAQMVPVILPKAAFPCLSARCDGGGGSRHNHGTATAHEADSAR